MVFVTFNIYCTERACRTEILTCTAAYTTFGVDNGNPHRFAILGVGMNQTDSAYGTVTGAVATFNTVGQRNTVLLNPACVTNLDG